MNKVAAPFVLVAVDEGELASAALAWVMRAVLRRGERLVVATPTPSAGASLTSAELARMRRRVEALVAAAATDSHMRGLRWTLAAVPEGAAFVDMLVRAALQKPRRIVLFLDGEQRPQSVGGAQVSVARLLARSSAAKVTVLSREQVEQFEDEYIWGCGVTTGM
ncbi:hypothetical protein HK105_207243 [Polyrhizophydium stewartii]|uniref:UspA domain-containing protein n=1 Tax=Polyrhizophydium stewartii TaxID=2732419 RepID=A0ABR4N146_9FUNG